MITVFLLDKYAGDGLTPETACRPAITDAIDFPLGSQINIETKHVYLPDPGVLVVKFIVPDLSLIENHPDYGPGAILYDIPNPYGPDDKPPAAEYGQRRAYAAKLGISNAQFRELFGTQGNPKRRKEGADNLINWIRTLPPQAKGKK